MQAQRALYGDLPDGEKLLVGRASPNFGENAGTVRFLDSSGSSVSNGMDAPDKTASSVPEWEV